MKPTIRVTRKMESAHTENEVLTLAVSVGYSGIRYIQDVDRLTEKYGRGRAFDFSRFQRGGNFVQRNVLTGFTRMIRLGRKHAREIEQNLNGANLVLSLA